MSGGKVRALALSLVVAGLGACDPGQKPAPARVSPPAPVEPSESAGTVLETMNSGGYTYVRLDCGGTEIWAAGPETPVAVGDYVAVEGSMSMQNFHSKTLDRTFETILFASALRVGGKQSPPTGHTPIGGEPPKGIDLAGIEKPEGGKTIAEVFAERDALSGKSVRLRGKVVKFNSMILNRNWIHIQDGTGTEGTNDLTVTTTDTAKVGDTVLVTGLVALDKDFGSGYRYDVLIEQATVTVE